MPPVYSRNRREGLAHRAKISRWIMPKLRPGCRIPSSGWMGRFLGVHPAAGYRHMQRVLDEAGVVTETRGIGCQRRVYVVTVGRVAP